MSPTEQLQHCVSETEGMRFSVDAAQKGPDKCPITPADLAGFLAEDFGWRNEVAKILFEDEATAAEANDFLWCGSTFRGIEVCSGDITHSRAIPISCHKRYCPTCARREAARLVANHTPQIKSIVDESTNKNHRLRRIELTTAIDIFDPDIQAKMKAAVAAVNATFDRFCGGKLSSSQSHRWAERSHPGYTGEGLMFTIEFGEDGRKLHFHCLFFGRYIDKWKLSDVWEQLSGYKITYVQHVPKTEAGIREALKYVSKNIKPKTDPKTGEILATLSSPKLVAQVAKVLHGSRRVFCRGAFRGLEDDISEPGANLGETICKQCGAATELVSLDIWSGWMYNNYVAALKRQLDLKPGNKSATAAATDSDPPGFENDPPAEAQVEKVKMNLTDYMWEQYEAQHGAQGDKSR